MFFKVACTHFTKVMVKVGASRHDPFHCFSTGLRLPGGHQQKEGTMLFLCSCRRRKVAWSILVCRVCPAAAFRGSKCEIESLLRPADEWSVSPSSSILSQAVDEKRVGIGS